jgi:hypothetical protein
MKNTTTKIKNAHLAGEFVLIDMQLCSYGHVTAKAYYRIKKGSSK